MVRAWVGVLVAVAVMSVSARQGDEPTLDVVLVRAAAYVTSYQTRLAGIVAEEHYDIGENDIKTQLLKIKVSNPDVIVVSGFGPAYPLIFKEMHAMGMNKTVLTDATISVPYFFSSAGGYETLDGVYFITTNFDLEHPANQRANDFVGKYARLSKYPPSFAAAFGYDTFMVVADNLLECGTESARIRECLSRVNAYQGILGTMKFNSEQEMQIPLLIRQYKNGKNTIVKTLN